MNQSKIFFIIGLGRSGTSLLQTIMNTFTGFCNSIEARIGNDRISCYTFVKRFNDFSYLERFIQDNWTKEYFIEKTPNSVLCLPQLFERYPNANYLFLERHPLKILLSQMNMFQPGEKDQKKREYDLFVGNIEKEDLLLNYEQHRANQVLKMIKAQVTNKHLFPKQLTIRYEDFISDLDSHLAIIENKFDIKANPKEAKKCLSRPSRSSKNNRYDIKEITDPYAINMIIESCRLWHYDYHDLK